MSSHPDLSIIVPVYNEVENIGPLLDEIVCVMASLGHSFEVLVVNDGSSDGTSEELGRVAPAIAQLRIIDLESNCGEAAALSAGFHAARGDIFVTLDGDGQNDPADIPVLLAALASPEVLAVSGIRIDRQEPYLLRLLPSKIANFLIARITGLPTTDCGCGLKAYRRSAVPNLQLPSGFHRFLPAIFGVQVHQFREVPARDRRRATGQSHYGLMRIFPVLRELISVGPILNDARRAHINSAIATAASAGLGAVLLPRSPFLTALCDVAAGGFAVVWWNARRFQLAQSIGVYRLRVEE